MSDGEHSQPETRASGTYQKHASSLRPNDHIAIANRPCKIIELSRVQVGKHGHPKCLITASDIFTEQRFEDILPSSHICDIPHVTRYDYEVINIFEDGSVSLLSEIGNTKDDIKLPTNETLISKIKDGLAEGLHLVVTIVSAMGEEQIRLVRVRGPH